MGPDELVRIGYVADRYYRGRTSRVALAAELGVSRFKISRMLEQAQELGIVQIRITQPDSIDTVLSNRLKAAYGLNHAIAVATPSQEPAVVQDSLGRIAAGLLEEVVADGDLIGIAAGRTLQAMTRYLSPLPSANLVSLCGVSNPKSEYSSQVIRRIADATGGSVWPIYAPFVVENPKTATALRSDPRIKSAMDLFSQVTLGLVVIGSWNPPDSQFFEAVDDFGWADEMLARGAVGEICATVLDRDGHIVHGLEDRTLSISDEELRNIPEVIAVAGGPNKTDAVRAAILSGLATSIVTDTDLALRLLQQDERSHRPQPTTTSSEQNPASANERGRPKAALILSADERAALEQWAALDDGPLALRARIVLSCTEGLANTEVAARLGINQVTVGKWRTRFVEHRLDGLGATTGSG